MKPKAWTLRVSLKSSLDRVAQKLKLRLGVSHKDRRKVVLGAAVRAKAQGCLFSFHGTRLLEIKSTRLLKKGD